MILRAYALFAPLIGKMPVDYTSSELAFQGVISFCLCLVNIVWVISRSITDRTIVIVGMVMFKLKELVKVKDKSEIWSEDIKSIRHTFDEEYKKRPIQSKKELTSSNLSNFGTTKTIPTETVEND